MTTSLSFARWFEHQIGEDAAVRLKLEAAFVIAVCRVEEAARQHARDPLRAVSNAGSYASRVATKSMLSQLGYSAAQTRIIQRLLAGSSSWPGLIRIYLGAGELTGAQRQYVRRQVRAFAANA
jgi:hypothetical protein